MKRALFFPILLLLLSLAFVGCTAFTPARFSALVPVSVLEYFTGPALADARVEVQLNGEVIGFALTNAQGIAEVEVAWDNAIGATANVEVSVTKVGYAPSVLRGLVVTGVQGRALPNMTVEMAAKRAQFDPAWLNVPELEISFLAEDGETPLDLNNIAAAPFKINITSEQTWSVLYIGVGYVPHARSRNDSSFDSATYNTTLTFGANGIVPIHIVAYNDNDARVDYVYFANVSLPSEEVLDRSAPDLTMLLSYTTDLNIEFYSSPREAPMSRSPEKSQQQTPDPRKLSKEIRESILNGAKGSRNAPAGCNILVKIDWVPNSGEEIGFNVYRSDDGEDGNYKLIVFRSFNEWLTTYSYDQGFGMEPGQRAWYKVRSVFADGTESGDSNIVMIIPLDMFDVDLITPADKSENVSQEPIFTWQPVKGGTHEPAELFKGAAPEELIIYEYQPIIFDCAHHDGQYIIPYAYDKDQENVTFTTIGNGSVTLPFLTDSYYDPWLEEDLLVQWGFNPEGEDEEVPYPYDSLEAYKTYEWGMYLAYGYYFGLDENGCLLLMQSCNTDLIIGVDWNMNANEPESFNRFVTGKDLGSL